LLAPQAPELVEVGIAIDAIFATLIGVIGLLTGIYSIPYVRHDIEIGNIGPGQVKQYYVFFSLLVFSMLLNGRRKTR